MQGSCGQWKKLFHFAAWKSLEKNTFWPVRMGKENNFPELIFYHASL